MIIGLKRSWVELTDYEPAWQTLASLIVFRLLNVFGETTKGVEHVGSTSIVGIKSKPIIDIAVAIDKFEAIQPLIPSLEMTGFTYRPNGVTEQQRYAVWHDEKNDKRICNIHIVKTDSTEWDDYINFRDYLNADSAAARAYEELKIRLANENPYDTGREKYLSGKHTFIEQTLADAKVWKKQRSTK